MFIVNVECAVYRANRWLIIERSKKEEHAGGLLSLVGGKVDQEGHVQDILERTVKREIDEEVGVKVKDKLHYVHSSAFVTDDNYHVVDIVFLCEYKSGDAYIKSPDEVDGVFWMTYEEVMQHPNAPIWLKGSLTRAENVRKNYTL